MKEVIARTLFYTIYYNYYPPDDISSGILLDEFNLYIPADGLFPAAGRAILCNDGLVYAYFSNNQGLIGTPETFSKYYTVNSAVYLRKDTYEAVNFFQKHGIIIKTKYK